MADLAPTTIHKNHRTWSWATLLLPLIAVSTLFLLTHLEKTFYGSSNYFQTPLLFFRAGILKWVSPLLIGLSYVHAIANHSVRERVFTFGSLLIMLYALSGLGTFLGISYLLYLAFSVGLVLLVKDKRRVRRKEIVLLSVITALGLRVYIDAYAAYLSPSSGAELPGWQLLFIGFLISRILVGLPLLLSDLQKARTLSFSTLASYYLNPVFFYHYLPIDPSEYGGSSKNQDSLAKYHKVIFQGWKLIALSILIKTLWLLLWKNIELPLIASVLRGIHLAVFLMSKLLFASGLLMICGFAIRPPFVGLLNARTPTDIWTSWNTYGREWQVRFGFFPALRMGANFYGAFLWTFFISGLANGSKFWAISATSFPEMTVALWIYGLWLALLAFIYRNFNLFIPSRFLALFRKTKPPRLITWILILILLAIPPFFLNKDSFSILGRPVIRTIDP